MVRRRSSCASHAVPRAQNPCREASQMFAAALPRRRKTDTVRSKKRLWAPPAHLVSERPFVAPWMRFEIVFQTNRRTVSSLSPLPHLGSLLDPDFGLITDLAATRQSTLQSGATRPKVQSLWHSSEMNIACLDPGSVLRRRPVSSASGIVRHGSDCRPSATRSGLISRRLIARGLEAGRPKTRRLKTRRLAPG